MSTNFSKYGFSIFRWVIALSCFIFLGFKIAGSGDSFSSALVVMTQPGNILLICLLILLMFFNWGIEALKWKNGAAVIEKISFPGSVSSVLAGVAVSMLGPNRTGEFIGRITALKPDNRTRGSFISIHISLAQTVVTIIAGLLSLMIINPALLPAKINSAVLFVFLPLLMIFFLLLYFRFADFYRIMKIRPLSRWFKNTDFESMRISNRTLTLNLLLSFLRYAVFITQFVLTFRIFGIALDTTDLYLSSAIIYLLIAVVPSFALAELGVRGTVAVYVMDLFSVASTPVIAASTLIWAVNIAIPAAAGAIILALRK